MTDRTETTRRDTYWGDPARRDEPNPSPQTQSRRITEHIEAGIEAASEMVSALPKGQQAWGPKEYRIAQIAAREAILSYQKAAL